MVNFICYIFTHLDHPFMFFEKFSDVNAPGTVKPEISVYEIVTRPSISSARTPSPDPRIRSTSGRFGFFSNNMCSLLNGIHIHVPRPYFISLKKLLPYVGLVS